MSNTIILESKNDKIFLTALIKYLNNEQALNLTIHNCYKLEGWSQEALIKRLKILEGSFQKEEIKKIGIMIDLDSDSKLGKLEQVNECIKNIFPEAEILSDTGQLFKLTTVDAEDIYLACYFTNVNNQGELETVLKTIKTRNSAHADCLEAWKNCLAQKKLSITSKEFDKFWISNYLRFDTCSKEEQKQAGKKCSMSAFDYIMEHKKDIWDFNHPVLDELKTFLKLFES